MKRETKGFTLVELLVVVTIVAILASILFLTFDIVGIRERSRTSTAKASLKSIGDAAYIYAADKGDWPADVYRDLPQDFIQYLSPGAWPNGPFPGSVYDWDNWADQTCWDGSTNIIQITLREIEDYQNEEDYTFYYVIQGVGIPHCHNAGTRGECINCPDRYP